jgi:hypothetical protein
MEDIWTWLKGCRTCDKPHEKRETGLGISWADPKDGHPYRSRLNPNTVDILQAEFEASR